MVVEDFITLPTEDAVHELVEEVPAGDVAADDVAAEGDVPPPIDDDVMLQDEQEDEDEEEEEVDISRKRGFQLMHEVERYLGYQDVDETTLNLIKQGFARL